MEGATPDSRGNPHGPKSDPNIVHDGGMCKVHDVYSLSADHLRSFSLLARPQDGFHLNRLNRTNV